MKKLDNNKIISTSSDTNIIVWNWRSNKQNKIRMFVNATYFGIVNF